MTKRYVNLRTELRKKLKGRGISDSRMEKLEDKYHVNLTRFYGENDLKIADKIVNKIAKQNPKRRRLKK